MESRQLAAASSEMMTVPKPSKSVEEKSMASAPLLILTAPSVLHSELSAKVYVLDASAMRARGDAVGAAEEVDADGVDIPSVALGVGLAELVA